MMIIFASGQKKFFFQLFTKMCQRSWNTMNAMPALLLVFMCLAFLYTFFSSTLVVLIYPFSAVLFSLFCLLCLCICTYVPILFYFCVGRWLLMRILWRSYVYCWNKSVYKDGCDCEPVKFAIFKNQFIFI